MRVANGVSAVVAVVAVVLLVAGPAVAQDGEHVVAGDGDLGFVVVVQPPLIAPVTCDPADPATYGLPDDTVVRSARVHTLAGRYEGAVTWTPLPPVEDTTTSTTSPTTTTTPPQPTTISEEAGGGTGGTGSGSGGVPLPALAIGAALLGAGVGHLLWGRRAAP